MCATTLLLATPASGAAPNFLLGVLGNVDRFQAQTGQSSQVRQAIVGWGQGVTWGVRTMARFVRTHMRVELLVYNAGKPGSPSDMGPRPPSRAAYRAAITPLGR